MLTSLWCDPLSLDGEINAVTLTLPSEARERPPAFPEARPASPPCQRGRAGSPQLRLQGGGHHFLSFHPLAPRPWSPKHQSGSDGWVHMWLQLLAKTVAENFFKSYPLRVSHPQLGCRQRAISGPRCSPRRVSQFETRGCCRGRSPFPPKGFPALYGNPCLLSLTLKIPKGRTASAQDGRKPMKG